MYAATSVWFTLSTGRTPRVRFDPLPEEVAS